MLTAAMLATARAYAESLMTSTCTIRERAAAAPTTGPDGKVTFAEGDVVYSGPCRIRPAGTGASSAQTTEAGGAELFVFDYLVSVPFAVTGIHEGMPCRIDSSPDPDAVDLQIEIQKVDRGEHITARRLFCSEVS